MILSISSESSVRLTRNNGQRHHNIAVRQKQIARRNIAVRDKGLDCLLAGTDTPETWQCVQRRCWGRRTTFRAPPRWNISQFSMLKGSFHYTHQSELDSRSDNSSFLRRIFGCA
jgi:hypothetical protein